MVITSDGGYRGNKTIDLKACWRSFSKHPCVEKVLVVKRTNTWRKDVTNGPRRGAGQ
jgi:acetyl-CoA synthetase